MLHGVILFQHFTHHGREFKLTLRHDDDSGPPWENDDGVGVVTDWTSRAKEPGERVLNQDHGSYRYYDMMASTEKAWRDCWGLSVKALEELSTKLGRPLMRGDIIHEAVERDFKRLRGWCNNDWYYVGVVVRDEVTGDEDSLWGVESDGDYWKDVRDELASGIHPLADVEDACVLGEN